MNEQEVERVAALLHEAFNEWHLAHTRNGSHAYPYGSVVVPFEELKEMTKDGYRHIARAVLADICPAPVVVEAR